MSSSSFGSEIVSLTPDEVSELFTEVEETSTPETPVDAAVLEVEEQVENTSIPNPLS